MSLTQRPVAILDDEDVHVVGPDVERVLSTLRAWLPDGEKKAADPSARADLRDAARMARKVVEGHGLAEDGQRLTLPTRRWNACLYALNEQGLQVVTTDMG